MLNERVSPQTAGVVRVVVFGFWLLNVALVHLEDLAALPLEVLERHGVLWLIPDAVWAGIWTPGFLRVFRVLLLGSLAWLVLGLPRYRAVAIAACVALTLFDGMEKSLGHINHSKFAMLYSAYLLAMFPCTDAVSLSRRPRRLAADVQYVAPVMAIAVLILLVYGFVGAYRIDRSGLEVFTSDAMKNWFLKRSYEQSSTNLRYGIWLAERPDLMFVFNAGFAWVGLLELLSPLCLLWRWFRWTWIASMLPFHVLSLLTMNIFFWPNALLILLVLTDSDRLFAPRHGRREAPILFFDGECALCNRAVRWLMASDPSEVFRFAALRGETARERLRGRPPEEGAGTLLLLDEDGVHERSEAVLRAGARLGGLWRGIALLRLLPRSLRDVAYDAVARNRVRWFGRVAACALIPPERQRLLLP